VNKTRRLAKVAVKKSTQALLKILIIQVSTKNNNNKKKNIKKKKKKTDPRLNILSGFARLRV